MKTLTVLGVSADKVITCKTPQGLITLIRDLFLEKQPKECKRLLSKIDNGSSKIKDKYGRVYMVDYFNLLGNL